MAQSSANGLLDNFGVNVPDVTKLTSKLPISSEIKYIDRTATQIIDQAPWMVMKIGAGVVIIILGWIFTGWLASRLNRLLVRTHVEETLSAFLASTARFVLFFNIFAVGLTVIGVSSASLAALLGAIGIAVGFGLRGTLASVAGGVMMIVHRPMKVGDWVEMSTPTGAAAGTVKRIGLFSTEINTRELVRVFVPNALMWESVLRNDTYNRMRAVKVEFGLGGSVDVREAFTKLRGFLATNALILKTPEPTLTIESMSDKGMTCALEAWVRTEDRRALTSTLLLDIVDFLHKEDIQMIFQALPQDNKAAQDKAVDASVAAQKGDKLSS